MQPLQCVLNLTLPTRLSLLRTWQHNMATFSHSTAICNQRFKKRIELRTQNALIAAHTEEEPKNIKATAAATAAHPRYLSSPAEATLHGKTQGFVPKLSPRTMLMQHPCSHYNAFCNLTSPSRLSLRTWQDLAAFQQPFHCDLQPESQETHRTTYTEPLIAEHRGGTKKHQSDRSSNRRTPEVPVIAGRSHFTRKNTSFRAETISQNEAHATSMQPLQCVLQPHVSNPPVYTRMATQHGNIQPFYRDLQPESQETHRTTYTEPLIAEHRGGTKKHQSNRSRNRRQPEVPFIAGRSHFTRKNTRFRAETISQNEAHATSMQPLQCVLQPHVANPPLSTHMATQHGNIQPFYGDLQPESQETHRTTYTEPLIAEHRGGTKKHQNDRSRNRRTPEVPFIAGRSHFTRKNTSFRAETISQNEAHATSMQPLQCVLQPHVSNPPLSTHMARSGSIHAAIPLRSATQDSTIAYRTTYTRRSTHCRTQRRNRFAPPGPQPHPPHTRGTFHRRQEPLYTEKHKVSCPNYLPKLPISCRLMCSLSHLPSLESLVI